METWLVEPCVHSVLWFGLGKYIISRLKEMIRACPS